MTAREFIKKIVESNFDLDMELTVEIKGMGCAKDFVDIYTDMHTIVLTQYQEPQEAVDFADDDIDMVEYEEYFANKSEMLDSMKINGVQ